MIVSIDNSHCLSPALALSLGVNILYYKKKKRKCALLYSTRFNVHWVGQMFPGSAVIRLQA